MKQFIFVDLINYVIIFISYLFWDETLKCLQVMKTVFSSAFSNLFISINKLSMIKYLNVRSTEKYYYGLLLK